MAAYFKTESFSAQEKITYRLLQTRLIKTVNTRIKNGEFTERGLAKLVGISQPQIHNVLKGARKLNVELADRLLWAFGLAIIDLLEDEEVAEEFAARKAGQSQEIKAPDYPHAALRKQPGQETKLLRRAAHVAR